MKKPKQPREDNGELHSMWCTCHDCNAWASEVMYWEDTPCRDMNSNYHNYYFRYKTNTR